MFFILIIVVALVAWALHLMQEAIDRKEFSLMLAGFLVSVAAAALVAVYFLVGHFVGYMDQMSQRAEFADQYYETAEFVFPSELIVEEPILNYAGTADSSYHLQGAISSIQLDLLSPGDR